MPTLHWLTRDEDTGAAARAPYRLLEEAPKLSTGDATAENMLIQGDNLEALKALLPFYAGRVKCVYIDPPYNTRSAFAHYDDNLEHATWLAMIWPRLELLRDLLADDGSIWVSIDDHEAHYLKVVMDEVFGRTNFIDTMIWRKNYSPKSSARHFSSDHDYILVFARDADAFEPNPMPRTGKQNKAYKNVDNDPRGLWRPNNLAARNYYSKGTYSIRCPGGRLIEGPPAGSYWRISEEKFREMDRDNRIWWGKDGNNVPAPKIYLSEVKQGVVPQTLWNYEDVGHTQDAKKEVVNLFGNNVFGTPKPESSSSAFSISRPTPAISCSTPFSVPEPPPPSRTRWGGAGSASKSANTPSPIARPGCARSSKANRAAYPKPQDGRAAAASASTASARPPSTPTGASAPTSPFPSSPRMSGSPRRAGRGARRRTPRLSSAFMKGGATLCSITASSVIAPSAAAMC